MCFAGVFGTFRQPSLEGEGGGGGGPASACLLYAVRSLEGRGELGLVELKRVGLGYGGMGWVWFGLVRLG